MSRFLSAAGSLVDTIKINALTREDRDGRPFWIKRRRWTARPIMACANRFFHLAGNPIRALAGTAAWQRWEVECFLRLHGERFQAFSDGDHAVAAEEVPGRTLSQHLNAGTLVSAMFAAAGRELRRAHEMECDEFRDPAWSHGDPHAGNFVYDESADRTRLIDFEVMHRPEISANERHAEDLLAFLQDIAGRIASDQWLPGAHAFLGAYARPEIVACLRDKLILPGGLPRIWWAVRTTYMASAELRRRISMLRESL
jgi:hypothetical protein